MTYEDRDAEIADYVRYLDLVHDEIFAIVDRAKVRLWVLGFSQGVATVARWVTRGKVSPDRVVFFAGILPPELDSRGAARLTAGAPLTVVLGTNDEFAQPDLIAQQDKRMREMGIPHRIIRFDGGHDIKPDVLKQIAESARI